MMIRYFMLFAALTFCLTLTACANLKPGTTRRAACNKLKSDLVFSGATSDTRQAEIESAEQPLAQRMYDNDNCDEY